MNATLKCSHCSNKSQVVDFNVARLGSECHVCGRWGSVSERLTNFYGATVGKAASKLLEQFARGRLSQNTDFREQLVGIDRRIEQAITGARA